MADQRRMTSRSRGGKAAIGDWVRNIDPCRPSTADLTQPPIFTVQRLGGSKGFYRAALRSSINHCSAWLVERSEEHMDNLEALQQVTLSDWNEAMLMAMCRADDLRAKH